MNKIILFVSHKKAQCGVFEFGQSIAEALMNSKRYSFIYTECASLPELKAAIAEHSPAAIIYNYHPSTMPWVATKIGPKLYQSNIDTIQIPQIGIIHEVTQRNANTATAYKKKVLFSLISRLNNSLFDFYVAPDPTLFLLNPCVYKTGRLIPSYQNNFPAPSKPVIGSFGFGTPQKGFEKIVQLVQQEFEEAVIRMNIPAADFADKEGTSARAIAKKCKALIKKPGIQLSITHTFMDNKALLNFLAENTINVFLYENTGNRGISSALDNAMAVQRPVAISNGVMFRHIFDVTPSIRVTENNLRTIIQNGFAPLQKYFDGWNKENILWEYERILDSIFLKQQIPPKIETRLIKKLKLKIKKCLGLPAGTSLWTRDSDGTVADDMRVSENIQYQPVQIPERTSLNRILDNKARELYAPAISKLMELVPETMAEKIALANVQQAFVFDTACRYIPQYNNPKILCVGSYKDTASMSLQKIGHTVEEIDPLINYYLQEFTTKPTTIKNSYDIILSTSVIEHDPNDESFIKCIAELLAPGGVAVLTCDYQDGWKPGQPKPEVNARFYTKSDLLERLLPIMDNCHLVDEPQWDCPNPDFNYLGKYQYTFATFVVKKRLKNDTFYI